MMRQRKGQKREESSFFSSSKLMALAAKMAAIPARVR